MREQTSRGKAGEKKTKELIAPNNNEPIYFARDIALFGRVSLQRPEWE
jgi:hypothetical protein